MDFDQLRQLDAIERCGTMLAASRELHISQPALSRSIQRLEAELGQPLFTRAGRHAQLNDPGHVAVEWARQILRDERLMRDAIDAVARRARALRIGTVAPAPLWRLAGLLVERFPQETLTSETISPEDVLRGVLDGIYDLGIVAEAPNVPGLTATHLMDENLAVSLPPNLPLAARKRVTCDDLKGETFLIFTDIGFWRERVDRALPHTTLIEQRDREVFMQLAHTTPHCIFVTDAPQNHGVQAGRAIVPLDDDIAHATFYLIARVDAPKPVRELFTWVQAMEEQLSFQRASWLTAREMGTR